MLEAFALGLGTQSSLHASDLLASYVRVPAQVVGWLAAFGAGALVCALTFDLTLQAGAETRARCPRTRAVPGATDPPRRHSTRQPRADLQRRGQLEQGHYFGQILSARSA
jgi:hypothetical protein